MGSFELERINSVILQALPSNRWESQAVFNPGTVRENQIVHMLYRAVEGNNFSTIGYAQLDINGKILHRKTHPVIDREWDIEKQGCEDPRIVPFGDKYYIFYTGFDGADMAKGENARIVLAETEDFTHYKKRGVIGPDYQDKDAMIFPQTINGYIAFLHRIQPNIQIAYFEDIEHLLHPEPDYWERHMRELGKHNILSPKYTWERKKIGAGPPPVLTEAGWLLIYHGVDDDSVYRVGAALLDEKNPYRVIARFPSPILEPVRDYEQFGDVNMVVFPEGVVQDGDQLQIYYGCADKVIGLAVCSLKDILTELWKYKI